jgi:hypothetical protein
MFPLSFSDVTSIELPAFSPSFKPYNSLNMAGKNIPRLILSLALLTLAVFFFSRNNSTSRKTPPISYKTHIGENGWGYSIFASDSVLLIKQDIIPGIQGTKGFKSELTASKTAEFVVYKIKKGIFPPAVTPEELDSLGVL